MNTDELIEHHPGGRPGTALTADLPAHEALYELGVTDGLPVVPPTPELVADMLAGGVWDAADVLLYEKTRDIEVTAYLAAVNAVMAGARPDYFPVIGAALQAIGDPAFYLHGPLTSTGGATIMIVVGGPIVEAIGIQCRENLFGPGFRANATIGRAVRLVQMNVLSAIPGQLDKSTQGWPGKFSLCFGEDVESSPWDPFGVRLGHDADSSVVAVYASESGHNVVNHGAAEPETLLLTFADAMAAMGSFSNGRSVVVFAPEHAKKIGAAGWSVSDVQSFLYDNTARDLATIKRAGKIEDDPAAQASWSGSVWKPAGDTTIQPGDETTLIRRGYGPDDILVLVGGGAAGGHSSFFPSWSRGRSCPVITREVQVP